MDIKVHSSVVFRSISMLPCCFTGISDGCWISADFDMCNYIETYSF